MITMTLQKKKNSKYIFSRLFFMVAFIVLIISSLFIGVMDISFKDVLKDPVSHSIFFISRIPRTLALLLSGCALSLGGLMTQTLTANKFVEPNTCGATASAGLGIILLLVFFPDTPLWGKMLVASIFAMLGPLILFLFLKRLQYYSIIMVPIIGLMISAILNSITSFLAIRFDLLQYFMSWSTADFTVILRGRYEMLWIIFFLILMSYRYAVHFMVSSLGQNLATTLGVNYKAVIILGLTIVAISSGVNLVVVGNLPFLGLIVPNLVSYFMGDHIKKNLPWVCVVGAGLTLLCDIISRTIVFPFEIPVGSIMGVIGAFTFLILLLKKEVYGKKA